MNLPNITWTDSAESGAFRAITDDSLTIASLLDTNTGASALPAAPVRDTWKEDILDRTFANTATLPAASVPEPGSLGLSGRG